MASMYVNVRVEVPDTTVAQLEAKYRSPNTDATGSNREAVILIQNLLSGIIAGTIDGEMRVGFSTNAVTPSTTGGSAVTISNLK